MPDKTSAPRRTKQGAPRMSQTASKVTLQPPDFNRCDRSCGLCFVTFFGDQRHCEREFRAQLRRELAELLAAGGGDRG